MKTSAPAGVFRFMDTPTGPLRLAFSPRGLATVEFRQGIDPSLPALSLPPNQAAVIERTLQTLKDYFSGIPSDFATLTLDLKGTPFQILVWQELMKIPPGSTSSYQELARRIGRPTSARAVGQACGANPIPIIIPCHRVIAKGGGLGGYSSGIERKRWLLRHEGVSC